METSKADESAASKPDGHYLRCLRRPECEAYLMLMRYYESRKDTDKAIAKAQELIQRVSPDGWHWELNKAIGDFYKRNGLEDEAKQQYRLALASVRQYIEIDKGHRDKLIDRIVATAPSGAPLPSDMEKIATDLEKMNSGTK